MLYVRLEKWPQGNRRAAKLLGELVIANVGGDTTLGDYQILLSKEGGFRGGRLESMTPGALSIEAACQLPGFARLPSTAWDLVTDALRCLFQRSKERPGEWDKPQFCVECGSAVERVRWCYARPTCFKCLPPPDPIPVRPFPPGGTR